MAENGGLPGDETHVTTGTVLSDKKTLYLSKRM